MATEKQVKYALYLMDQKGYGTGRMYSAHKRLGATMRERQGLVRDWLSGMEMHRISRLIDSLKAD